MKNEIRPSKIVMTFGPGSIIDMPNRESYIVMGPDFWIDDEIIRDDRLARKLNVNHFGTPITTWNEENKIKLGFAIRDFPYTRICLECGKLTSYFYCDDCKKPEEKKGPKTMPPRLVAVCKNGHIQDFPWRKWIIAKAKCQCKEPDLYLTGDTIEADESDLHLVCKSCNRSSSLQGALGPIGFDCDGKRPWLGDTEECQEKLWGLMRGASNVFFPVLESSLSVPPYSNKIIQRHAQAARTNWLNNKIIDYIKANVELQKYIEKGIYTEEQLVRAFDEIFGKSSVNIKGDEWDRFLDDNLHYTNYDYFQAEKLDLKESPLKNWFDRIVLVKKLREVVAISGFTRIEPYNPEESNGPRIQNLRMSDDIWHEFLDKNRKKIKPIINENNDRDWLPGVELFGEGIFFKFKDEAIRLWEKEPTIKKRCEEIISQPNRPFKREGLDTTDIRTVLVHTFSHLLIRQITLDCGYSMTSLRERLYVEKNKNLDMCGTLIYTASSDSEGTLGGLIAQAKDSDILNRHIQAMISSLSICSQDPLCGSHSPSDTKKPWGAACHSCTHLPETSCEGLQNKLLDRFALAGNEEIMGYFHE